MESAVTASSERRRGMRVAPTPEEPFARVRLRTGRELTVVNIGPTGALVETDGRLLPGTGTDVHVVTSEGRELIRSRIVRVFVHSLSADRVVYRGALAFERLVTIAKSPPDPQVPADPRSVHA